MAQKRKSSLVNYDFESSNAVGGKFTKICGDMISSMAWKKLSVRQQGLYLELKSRFTKKSDGTTNQFDISITEKQFRNRYSKNTLMKDVDSLIENGFIKVVNHGKLARLPNIYGFSSMWKKYNTKDFFIHPNDRRLTNKNSSI